VSPAFTRRKWSNNLIYLNEAQATVQQINDAIIRKYYFNTVALPDTSSSELYQRVLRPAVLKACRGYNTTFFGYGGVGTGKSFTFHGNRASPGFILLTVGDIFLYIANHQHRQFLLRFSCCANVDGYLFDLLGSIDDVSKPVSEPNLLRTEFVRSANEFVTLLLSATTRERQLRSLLMHSCFHIVFRLYIESRDRKAAEHCGDQCPIPEVKSCISLVKLAASVADNHWVNNSLLGVSPSGNRSQLTMFLRPQLADVARTCTIVCVFFSPLLAHRDLSHVVNRRAVDNIIAINIIV